MDAWDIIRTIAEAEKRTPVKLYVKTTGPVDFGAARVFGGENGAVVFGDWEELKPILENSAACIADYVVEGDRRNSGVPLLDTKELPARIEPGAILRERVDIRRGAVVMMGAVVNIGATIGQDTMVDMNAVIGSRATVGDRCHIGAGAVLAGVVEPPSALPVEVEDDVLIGANAVVLEGVRVGRGAVVAAGAVVTENVPPGAVAAGMPARVIKQRDGQTDAKTVLVEALRKL